MSTLKQTTTTIAVYYVIVFGGREVMRNFTAFKAHKAFIVHNYFLSALSGALLVCFIKELVPAFWKHGLYSGVCGEAGWSQRLELLYYLNYLTKYLELIDTGFLFVKKKPLTFLHTYHHGATALLCYTQLVGKTSVSWLPITLNLGVHVVMYWYYAQAARGIKVWWKKFITVFQITQFVLDLGFICYATWQYFASEYMPSLPHHATCGEKKQEAAAATGCAIITSYLVLFIMFYISTYKRPSAKRALRKASKAEVPGISETTEKAADVLRSASQAIAEKVVDEDCKAKI